MLYYTRRVVYVVFESRRHKSSPVAPEARGQMSCCAAKPDVKPPTKPAAKPAPEPAPPAASDEVSVRHFNTLCLHGGWGGDPSSPLKTLNPCPSVRYGHRLTAWGISMQLAPGPNSAASRRDGGAQMATRRRRRVECRCIAHRPSSSRTRSTRPTSSH